MTRPKNQFTEDHAWHSTPADVHTLGVACNCPAPRVCPEDMKGEAGAFCDLELFVELGSLLKTWRKFTSTTQAELARRIGCDPRQVRRWERAGTRVSLETAHEISSHTGIPMAVIHDLLQRRPVYYSCTKRRYAYSAAEFSVRPRPDAVLALPDEAGVIGTVTEISAMSQIRPILAYDHAIYPTAKPVRASVIAAAARTLPELNLFCSDTWDQYSGHLVCFPMSASTYEDLREQRNSEGDLTEDQVTAQSVPSVFYFYSIYAPTIGFSSMLLRRAAKYFLRKSALDDALVAGYTVTKEGEDLCRDLGMREVYSSASERLALGTEVAPVLFETTVGCLRQGLVHRQP